MPKLKLDNSVHTDSISQVDKPLSPSTDETSTSVDMKAPKVSAPIRKPITEWIANGRRLSCDFTNHNYPISVAELIASYWRCAKAYYQKNGQPTGEHDWIRYAAKPLRHLYGQTNAADF